MFRPYRYLWFTRGENCCKPNKILVILLIFLSFFDGYIYVEAVMYLEAQAAPSALYQPQQKSPVNGQLIGYTKFNNYC